MNTAKLLKRAPTLMMVVCLAYACYRINTIVPERAPGRNELAKGLDVMVKDVLYSGALEVKTLTGDALRDPFRTRVKSSAVARAAEAAAADPETDPLASFVHSLSLDATFLQGKAQIAIINGRMYHKGQHLILQDDGANVPSPLFVESVQAHRVLLRAHDTNYELGYPEGLGTRPPDRRSASGSPGDLSVAEIDPEGQLAFYKKLLNSPLSKLGKGLTGNPDAGGPGSGRFVRKR